MQVTDWPSFRKVAANVAPWFVVSLMSAMIVGNWIRSELIVPRIDPIPIVNPIVNPIPPADDPIVNPTPVPNRRGVWVVLRDGQVIQAERIVAVAKSSDVGRYEAAWFPETGAPESLVIDINRGGSPAPPVDPEPLPPIDPAVDLKGEAKVARDAAVLYFHRVAANYRTVAGKEWKTVTEAMDVLVSLDEAARQELSASIKGAIRPKVGGAAWPKSEGAAVLNSLADGFEEVR